MNPTTRPRKGNAFGKLVRQPGGMTMDEAVRAADANLQTIRGQVRAEVEAAVERMQALGRASQEDPHGGALEELYDAVNAVIGLAGHAGLPALGQVCYSLCELIDRLQASRTRNGPAVQVHMDSMRLLCPGADGGDGGAGQEEAIVAALKRVVARL